MHPLIRSILAPCFFGIAASAACFAQLTPEAIYISKYVEFMAPRMLRSVQMQAKTEGISLPDAEGMTRQWARLAAACQVAAFSHYPPKYKDIAFDVVAKGGSIPDSNSRIQEEFLVDMQSNPAEEEGMNERAERVAAEAGRCIADAGRQAGFK